MCTTKSVIGKVDGEHSQLDRFMCNLYLSSRRKTMCECIAYMCNHQYFKQKDEIYITIHINHPYDFSSTILIV